jgi:hypothetical protein
MTQPPRGLPGTFIGAHAPQASAADHEMLQLEFIAFDAGHWPMVSAPDRLAELIHSVLSKLK